MKKLTLFSLLLFTVSALSAQSNKPRKASELETMAIKIIKEQNYELTNRVFASPPYWEEISLRHCIDSTYYNSIEYDLLQKYSDIIVSPYFHCYFTITDNGDIGVVNLIGEELLPPISKSIKQLGFFGLAGERTTEFDISFNETSEKNLLYNVAYPLGLCASVLRFSRKGVETVIPLNKYDYISTIPIGQYIYRVRGFYVGKFDDNNKLIWGLCDKNGKEIIECKYKGIIFENGKFKGTDDMDMNAIAELYDDVVYAKKQRREKRDATLALISAIGNGAGNVALGIGFAMQQSQSGSAGVSAGDSSSKASGGVDYLSQYRRWERLAERHYNSITNLGTSVKHDDGSKSGSAGQSMGPATYTSMKKSYREAQQEMARIRRKAAQAGVSIPQSPWETNTISY